jgi:hypothetical protein
MLGGQKSGCRMPTLKWRGGGGGGGGRAPTFLWHLMHVRAPYEMRE